MLLWLAAGLLLAPPPCAAAKETPRWNLVLIAIDGLRADHCGIYGYPRATTPRLDKRAETAVVFERAFSQASWTLPSFTTLFTSRHPEDHGVLTHSKSVPAEFVLLPQVLREAGLRTAGFVGGHYLDPSFGLSRGFDHYRAGGMGVWRFFAQTAPQAARWIRENRDRRFFVFVHGNDVHPPFDLPEQDEAVRHAFDSGYRGPADDLLADYAFVLAFNRKPGDRSHFPDGANPPAEYYRQVDALRSSPREIEHLVAHYDARVLEADRQIEAVFEALRSTGRDKDTVVIVTADHGLELGEKGKLATAFHATAFNSVLRVPLLLWAPGLEPRRISEPVQLVDLAPTLLELLGIPSPPAFKGRSLAGLARGESSPGPRYAFSASSVLTDPGNSVALFAAQDRRWKLIYAPQTKTAALYDLEQDPSESSDVRSSQPEALRRLLGVLREHLAGRAP